MMKDRVRGTSMGVLLVVACVATIPAYAADQAAVTDVQIPYERFVLDNGLTLIVHEDRKAPIVAVNVWYHVGSKNEKAGRTGFAHLFEHLMFNGSENFDDDYFQAMAQVGATTLNGTTNEDRTNYFQNVPTSAIDVALWMESDRMGHLLGAVTRDKLDEQIGVVQNEKRQGENQPYAIDDELIASRCYPDGHPYSHTVIGSLDDLAAATLDDVKEWFATSYGPSNAVVVVAGDIDAATARAKVEAYFGDIPPGPPLSRPESWIAERRGEVREVATDRVPHARVYLVWNVPEWGSEDHDRLELIASILADGKTSRLYKRLVYDEQIARTVNAFVDSREIGSLFKIVLTAQPGADLARIEREAREELARLLRDGPTAAEIERARTSLVAGFVRGIETIGGFGGKSDILAHCQVFVGDPGCYRDTLRRAAEATPAALRDTARRWLSDGVFALEIHPFPELAAAPTGADRSALPTPAPPPPARFATLQRDRLSNGLQLILAERHATPVVEMRLLVDAGYAADMSAVPGTASLTLAMLDEGAGSRSALEISDALDTLGAQLWTDSNTDQSSVNMSALTAKLDASLDLFADAVLRPTFPEKELKRLRTQQLTGIAAEKSQPFAMALRTFPVLLYGKDHAYGVPMTGSGYEDTVAGLGRDDLVRFHETWFRPNHATLVIVGDTTMAEIKPRLERRFGAWKPGDTPTKNLATVAAPERPTVYILDRPGSIQSVIMAGHLAPPRGAAEDLDYEMMNQILGGSFIARMNMNLREDKHWSYGAQTVLLDARGQRPLLVFAPVQTDRTAESMTEILKELNGIRGARPITPEELSTLRNEQMLALPGSWETSDAVAGSIAEMVRFGLPADWFDTYAERLAAVDRDAVAAAATAIVHPERLVWVVVGDRATIEPRIRELGIGPVEVLEVR